MGLSVWIDTFICDTLDICGYVPTQGELDVAENKPEVEPEVVDVDALPTVDTFEPDDEYDESDVPELGEESDADFEEHEYEKENLGGEEL